MALLWLAIGIGAGVAMLAALASLDAGEQLRVLAALAAGIGLIQLWLSLEASSPAGLWAGAISGSAMVLLALGAVPDRPALVGVAYLLGALAMLVRVQRAAPLLLSSGAGLAVLGLLGPGLGG